MMLAIVAVGVIVACVGLYALASGIYAFLQEKIDGESLTGLFFLSMALLGVSIGFFALGTRGFDSAYMAPSVQSLPHK